MSTLTSLPKWIQLSVCKHFTDIITTLHVFVEGQERRTNQKSDWCELRVDGPWLRQYTRTDLGVYTEVNSLISTFIDDTNVAKEATNIGLVLAAFTDLTIYKYGSEVADDGSVVGCMQLLPTDDIRERLEIARFGQIEPEYNLLQSTIEGHYKMILTV